MLDSPSLRPTLRLPCFLLILTVLVPATATAIPAFARKYGTSCQTCHIVFPKLNAFGGAFRLNGFRMPKETEAMLRQKAVPLGAPAYRRLWPKAVWPGEIPGNLPLAVNVQFADVSSSMMAGHDTTTTVTNDFQFPQEANLFAGGTLGDHISFFSELTFADNPDGSEDVEIEHAALAFDSPFGPQNLLHVRLGKLAPNLDDPFQEMWLMTDSGIDPLFAYNPVGARGGTGLAEDGTPMPIELPAMVRGIEAYGIIRHRLLYVAGVVNGMPSTSADRFDANNAKERDLNVFGAYLRGTDTLDRFDPAGALLPGSVEPHFDAWFVEADGGVPARPARGPQPFADRRGPLRVLAGRRPSGPRPATGHLRAPEPDPAGQVPGPQAVQGLLGTYGRESRARSWCSDRRRAARPLAALGEMVMIRPTHLVPAAGILALALAGAGFTGRTDQQGSIHGLVAVDGIPANATAVVFLEKAAGRFAPPSQAAVMDQKDLKFVPHVLPILFGTTVKFVNSDRVPHSVFSPDHETYNLGTWSPGQSKTYTFSKDCKTFPCVYTQLCALHADMEAFIVVLGNPYFARTDSRGNFTLEGVPAGEHQVGVWAPDAKVASQAVTVKAGAPATVNFMLSGK